MLGSDIGNFCATTGHPDEVRGRLRAMESEEYLTVSAHISRSQSRLQRYQGHELQEDTFVQITHVATLSYVELTLTGTRWPLISSVDNP